MSKMNLNVGIILVTFLVLGGLIFWSITSRMKEGKFSSNDVVKETPAQSKEMGINNKQIQLPAPRRESDISVEEAIVSRRSRRDFSAEPLTLGEISQILWAAQGITDKEKDYRAAPSAGALYPLELYLVVKVDGVSDIETGVYHYLPAEHSIERILEEDVTSDLAVAALAQNFIEDAPASLVITAEYSRVTGKYEDRGRRYVHMEAGHAAENVYLQAESLELGTVTVGAFDDEKIVDILQIPVSHEPLYIMPIGNPK